MKNHELATVHTILDAIHDGKDGSVHLVTGEVPSKGYMVGGASWTMTVTPENLDAYVVADFINAHRTMLSWEHHFIGWWEHEGRIYFDVSDNVTDYFTALTLGHNRKEKAIYSFLSNQELPCL